MRQAIFTKDAPIAIGSYSQAIKVGNTVYLSGQIPLHPQTMVVVEGDIIVQAKQVFENVKKLAEAVGGNLDSIVKLTVFLTDIANLAMVNEVMKSYFQQPYPARTAVGVAALPKGADIEVEAVLILS